MISSRSLRHQLAEFLVSWPYGLGLPGIDVWMLLDCRRLLQKLTTGLTTVLHWLQFQLNFQWTQYYYRSKPEGAARFQWLFKGPGEGEGEYYSRRQTQQRRHISLVLVFHCLIFNVQIRKEYHKVYFTEASTSKLLHSFITTKFPKCHLILEFQKLSPSCKGAGG